MLKAASAISGNRLGRIGENSENISSAMAGEMSA